MTGDRPLTDHEKRRFLSLDGSMDALSIVREKMHKGGEPTLHDVALIEMLARLETHTNFIVQHGGEIEALKLKLEALIELMIGLQKLVEKRKT